MRGWALRIGRWLRSLVRPRPQPEAPVVWSPAPEPVVQEPSAPAPPPQPPVATRKPKGGEKRPAGTATLRRDILDQLDKYQVYIKRLKKHDPDAYATYHRLGAYVLNLDIRAARNYLEPAVVRQLPGFGAFALCLDVNDGTDDNKLPVRFAYFTKLTRPGHDIERSNHGTTYRCRFYCDDDADKVLNRIGCGASYDLAVNVMPDGTLRALRMLTRPIQTIRHRRGNHRSHVVHREWKFSPGADHVGDPIKNCLEVFCLCMNFWIAASQGSMIRITATKHGMAMPFSIDPLKTPAFFSDREKVMTANGGRAKPIFHIVRPHMRKGKAIKLHFHGLREFKWHDHAICITVPGRDHLDHSTFDVGAYEVDPGEAIDPGFVPSAKMADMIADAIDRQKAG